MKKLLAILLAATTIITLCSCSMEDVEKKINDVKSQANEIGEKAGDKLNEKREEFGITTEPESEKAEQSMNVVVTKAFDDYIVVGSKDITQAATYKVTGADFSGLKVGHSIKIYYYDIKMVGLKSYEIEITRWEMAKEQW